MTDFWGRIPLEFAGGRLDHLNFALHLAAEARRAHGKAQVLLDPVVGPETLGVLTQHADFREIPVPPNWATVSHPEFRAALLDLLPARPPSVEILNFFPLGDEEGGDAGAHSLWTQLLRPLGVQILPPGSAPPAKEAATELSWSGMWTWMPGWAGLEEIPRDIQGKRNPRSFKNHSGIQAKRKKWAKNALLPGGRPQGQTLSILSAALSLGLPLAHLHLLLKGLPREHSLPLVLKVPA